jgi:hypothetical protein
MKRQPIREFLLRTRRADHRDARKGRKRTEMEKSCGDKAAHKKT